MLGSGNEVCADCSAPSPQWASLNRGVAICDDCCSVHRSMGRHISQVRSLHHMFWPATLQEMFRTLVSKGANSIWEHSLKDSRGSARKPNPKDKIDRVKKKFIYQKYTKLAFMNRPPVKDTNESAIEDLSQQLHASVRGNNLETVLRFLALGAKPNFQHPDRGNMPLHVAASAGQQLQCELLVVYGADPCALDSRGHTPVECARIAGYHETADRLIECQYELTDRLASYVCGRRPVHISGEHHILPSLTGSTDVSSAAIEARQRLRNLPNQCFEELASDVYDEVDRRETEQVWLETHQSIALSSGHLSVPFLPFNSAQSALRFQGRQKLATFNSRDFATLLIDILTDAKRRQMESMERNGVEGNLVPIDGLEVIQQQQLEELKEMERRRESEAIHQRQLLEVDGKGAKSTDEEVLTPVNNSDQDLGETFYDQVQHDYDEVTFEGGKPKFASTTARQKAAAAAAAAATPDGKAAGKPPVAPKPAKPKSTKDAEVQTSLSATDSGESLVAKSSPPKEKRTSDESVDGAELDEKDRRLKEAEYRIEQLIQLNTGMGEEIRLLQAMVQKLMQENSMLRTMQGRSSSLSGGSSSPKVTQDMYVMHQGVAKSPASSTYVSSQMLQWSGRFTSAPSAAGHKVSEPPPIPEKASRRQPHAISSHGAGERSLSTSALASDHTSPNALLANAGHELALRRMNTTGDPSPRSGVEENDGGDSSSGKSRGRGSPLAHSRSSPIGQQERSSPTNVLAKSSPSPEQRRVAPVNGSGLQPPKLPPKKSRSQSVYDSSPMQVRKDQANNHRSSTAGIERTGAFDGSPMLEDRTRAAAFNGSHALGRSSVIISPSGKSGTSGTGGGRSTLPKQAVIELSGYNSSGSSPASRRTLTNSSSVPYHGSQGNVNNTADFLTAASRAKKAKEQDLVVQQTEQITKRIQELLRTAKNQELPKFISCSRKIAAAVNDMASLFPNRPDSESVRSSLACLVSSAARLKEECHVGNQLSFTIRRDQYNKIVPDDEEKVRTVTQAVIQCAWDIARAARELVQHVEETIRSDTDLSK